jgi:chromate transporter
VLKQFRESKTVDAVFYGLRPCSIALIAAAGLLVARVTFLNQDALAAGFNPAELLRWKELLLAAVLLVLTRFVKPLKKLHPVVFIALSAAVGILFAF